jgi:hypothetical protein
MIGPRLLEARESGCSCSKNSSVETTRPAPRLLTARGSGVRTLLQSISRSTRAGSHPPSTRLTCSAKESSSRTRLPSILAEFGSSTSRLSDNPGARTRRITRGRCAILSREEVNSLIEAAPTPFQRTLLMALYATGTTSGKTDIQARGGPKAGSNSGA